MKGELSKTYEKCRDSDKSRTHELSHVSPVFYRWSPDIRRIA